jgi:spermidine/putrescine transport system substrate-binding protein
MSQREDGSFVEPGRMQEILRRRLTRRSLLRGAGTGASALSLGAILAACGDKGGAGGGGEDTTSMKPGAVFGGEPTDTVEFANWPLYLDQAKDNNGDVYHPSLRVFEKETGIHVEYQDVIQDNAEFFGKLRPQLEAGDPTGWDIIVITNGTEFTALVQNNWVYALDTTKRPNFDANAQTWAKDPYYDPNNAHSMAWQSGITGIGVNKDLVKAPVTKMDDLANPDIVGSDSVGMLKSDMPDFVMINLGIDPKTSGPDEWREAAGWLQKQRDAGTVRQYYTQGYIDDLTGGNLSATMAWSGDVLYNALWAGYTNLDFVFPQDGALLWIDNMLVPVGADNPAGAMQVMDFFYRPEIATMVTEWVLYMSPVTGVKELILKDAQQAQDQNYKGYANKLFGTAESPYLFPDEEFLAKTSFGRQLKTDDEVQEWNSIFLPISQG